MRRMTRLEIAIAAGVAAVLVAAALAGLSEALGAHPWWARQTGIVGGLGGAVLWLVGLRRAGISPLAQLTAATLALLTSAAAVYFGKQAFVASYAENALAGRFWYFG